VSSSRAFGNENATAFQSLLEAGQFQGCLPEFVFGAPLVGDIGEARHDSGQGGPIRLEQNSEFVVSNVRTLRS
jgi:hypothetical protein